MNNEPVGYIPNTALPTLTEEKHWVVINATKFDESDIPLYTHPVKELTDEDRVKVIGTLKWAEDLLREAGHDEAVNEVQDCIMLLRKAQEK